MRRFIAGLAIGLATSSAQALCPPDGPPCWEIALFADADCQKCNLSVPLFQWRDFYIKAGGNTNIGLLGAEFRVVGLPADWLHFSTANEFASQPLGDPLDGVGCNISFTTPQVGDCVLLYRVTILAPSEAQDVVLSVEQRNPPSSPQFQCPRVVYSCPPCSASCALGGSMSINSSNDCTVGIDASNWSAVKSLYSE